MDASRSVSARRVAWRAPVVFRVLLASGAALIVVTGVRFPQRPLYIALALVLISAVFVAEWIASRRSAGGAGRSISLRVGLIVGLLWAVEIAMNNVVQPGLPLRDVLDNVFWAVISLALLAFCLIRGRADGVRAAVSAGWWSGLASGAVACMAGLIVVVFGMPFLVSDPLEVAEWIARGRTSGLTDQESYVAFQTLAGAVGHLVLIGGAFGVVFGIVGGAIGRLMRARGVSA